MLSALKMEHSGHFLPEFTTVAQIQYLCVLGANWGWGLEKLDLILGASVLVFLGPVEVVDSTKAEVLAISQALFVFKDL